MTGLHTRQEKIRLIQWSDFSFIAQTVIGHGYCNPLKKLPVGSWIQSTRSIHIKSIIKHASTEESKTWMQIADFFCRYDQQFCPVGTIRQRESSNDVDTFEHKLHLPSSRAIRTSRM